MLWHERQNYLKTKVTLGSKKNLTENKSLYMTNAKLTAVYLDAQKAEKPYTDEREYVYPDNIIYEYIPSEVIDYFNRMYDKNIPDKDLFGEKLDIVVGGCPVTIGYGGIHGAIPTYREKAAGTRSIRNQDVASYYPHLVTIDGYCSRNIPNPKIYEDMLETRINGYVLKCDISNFFGNTSHAVAFNAIKNRVDDEWVLTEVERIINSFVQGDNPDVGMGLGSQVTQLIELSVLDDLDHYIKEQLHIKHYIRYMDDFILIHKDKEYLKYCRAEIEKKLSALNLSLSAKKTQLFPITQSVRFLGFGFRLTETGKVIMKLLPEKVTQEKRRLRKLVKKAKNGELTREKVDECFEAWKAHACKGDTYNLIKNMEIYYNNLWR